MKSSVTVLPKTTITVSLFTREWIEIPEFMEVLLSDDVSLFTREWIEISPYHAFRHELGRLPLYEGVD